MVWFGFQKKLSILSFGLNSPPDLLSRNFVEVTYLFTGKSMLAGPYSLYFFSICLREKEGCNYTLTSTPFPLLNQEIKKF